MLNKEEIKLLNETVGRLESFCLRVDQGVITNQEFDDALYGTNDFLKTKLKFGSDEYKLFDNLMQKYTWRPRSKPGYAQDRSKIEDLIEIIKKILGLNTSHVGNNEISFSSTQEYEAKRVISKIIQGAQEEIIIIDNYLDDKIFDFLDGLDNSIKVYLLTDQKKLIFTTLYIALKKQKQNIFAKYNNESHDRYIIIDKNIFYHLGASINTIGKKDFMINKIESTKAKDDKLNEFNNWWQKGIDIQ